MNNLLQAVHVTKEGKRMLIAEMDDDHLLNTIHLFVKAMNEVYLASRGVSNKYQSKLYGVEVLDPEQAAIMINDFLSQAAPYFFEAFFRSSTLVRMEKHETIINLMRSFLEREGKLTLAVGTRIPKLSSGTAADYLDEDDDPEW